MKPVRIILTADSGPGRIIGSVHRYGIFLTGLPDPRLGCLNSGEKLGSVNKFIYCGIDGRKINLDFDAFLRQMPYQSFKELTVFGGQFRKFLTQSIQVSAFYQPVRIAVYLALGILAQTGMSAVRQYAGKSRRFFCAHTPYKFG